MSCERFRTWTNMTRLSIFSFSIHNDTYYYYTITIESYTENIHAYKRHTQMSSKCIMYVLQAETQQLCTVNVSTRLPVFHNTYVMHLLPICSAVCTHVYLRSQTNRTKRIVNITLPHKRASKHFESNFKPLNNWNVNYHCIE